MMRVATHNLDAQQYAAHLLAQVGDPHSQTRSFYQWIESRLEWEREGILEALAAGEPVRGFNPGHSESIDTWTN